MQNLQRLEYPNCGRAQNAAVFNMFCESKRHRITPLANVE